MPTLLLALAPAFLSVQSGCDAVAATVHLDQGAASGPIQLGHLGLPLVGGPLPRLLLDGGAPGSPGFVGLGVDALTLPIGPGATLFTLPLLFVPFTLDGDGSADLDLAPGFLLPPSTCGSLVVLQAGVLDAAASGGLWYTDGLELHPGAEYDQPAFGGARFGEIDFPHDVVVADLDGDGVDDLLVPARSGDVLVTLRGDGAGRYEQIAERIVGLDPFQVATADFDGDGHTDAVVGHLSSWGPRVLFGSGDGTFATHVQLSAGHGGGVGAGDVNGDGHPDVVAVAGGAVDELLVFAGDGAGGFAAPTGVPFTPGSPFAVPTPLQLADLDGDGALDVVLQRGVSGTSFENLVLMINDGAGAFAAAPDSPLVATQVVIDFDLGDVDGDGAVDIVGVGQGWPGMTTFLNDGSAGFAQRVTNPLGVTAIYGPTLSPGENVALHDLDGDGVLDAAVSFSGADREKVALFAGAGDGGFSFTQSLSAGLSPDDLAVCDADGDGQPDLVVADRAARDVVLLPGAPGVALQGPQILAEIAYADDLVGIDHEGDGDLDLVMLGRDDDVLRVHENDGSGEFALVQELAMPTGFDTARAADVDGDGREDLVAIDYESDSLGVALAQAAGGFAPFATSTLVAGSGPFDLSLADFDGDGDVDVVTADRDQGSISVLLGAGDGTFAPLGQTAFGVVSVIGVETCDANGDGLRDVALITGNTSGPERLIVLGGNGDGTFVEIYSELLLDSPLDLVSGDLDADGFDEVIAVEYEDDASLHILFGGTTLDPQQLVTIDVLRPESVAVGDVDGDGRDDLVVQNRTYEGTATVLRSSGASTNSLEVFGEFRLGDISQPKGVVVADLDGDQRADLATRVSVSLQRTPSPLDE